MFELFKVLFCISLLGTVVSIILLLMCVVKYNKKLKIVSATLLIFFIFFFALALAGGVYLNEKSSSQTNNKVNNQTKDNAKLELKSGSNQEPVILTVKNFYVDSNNFIVYDLEITNNTKYTISNIMLTITYNYSNVDGVGDKQLCLSKLSVSEKHSFTSYTPYVIKEDDIDIKYHIKNLNSITFDSCDININGKEQHMTSDELKKFVDTNK